MGNESKIFKIFADEKWQALCVCNDRQMKCNRRRRRRLLKFFPRFSVLRHLLTTFSCHVIFSYQESFDFVVRSFWWPVGCDRFLVSKNSFEFSWKRYGIRAASNPKSLLSSVHSSSIISPLPLLWPDLVNGICHSSLLSDPFISLFIPHWNTLHDISFNFRIWWFVIFIHLLSSIYWYFTVHCTEMESIVKPIVEFIFTFFHFHFRDNFIDGTKFHREIFTEV